MRKIFLHFAVTLDGMTSDVEHWVSLDDEALNDSSADQDRIDGIIFGKNTYAGLTQYWLNAETSSSSAAERAFAKKINDMPKYILSHGEVELGWRNSKLLQVKDGQEFKQAIQQLKNAPGNDLWVDAGEGAWRSFLEYDLWDGLDMLVHPLVIGKGQPLFTSTQATVPLRLVHSKAYANGVINLRYEKVRGSTQ